MLRKKGRSKKEGRSNGSEESAEYHSILWPKLLGVVLSPSYAIVDSFNDLDLSVISLDDQKVIRHDVERSFNGFTLASTMDSEKIYNSRLQLHLMILQYFYQHPEHKYIQGFHDVASLHFLACGRQVGQQTLESHATQLLVDFLDSEKAVDSFNSCAKVLKMLETIAPKLHLFLRRLNVLPFFCLSWLVSHFSHDISDINVICKLYEAIFKERDDTNFILYLSLALLKKNQTNILKKFNKKKTNPHEAQGELHQYLKELPRTLAFSSAELKKGRHCNVLEVIEEARKLQGSHPIESFQVAFS